MMLRVERHRAGELLKLLSRRGVLDRSRRTRKIGQYVDIPVLAPPPPGLGEVLGSDGELQERLPPIELIRREAAVPEGLRSLIPAKWERLGRVLVIRLPQELIRHKKEVAEAYARVLGAETVLLDTGGSTGEMRLPSVERLLGDGTETIHLEDGVRYSLDAARIMFSSGNIAERMRMGRIVREGETVVDMFAGIGYFSLPMAVHGRPARIFACELNPMAFHYLRSNVRLNRVGGVVEPLLGDCRLVAPEGVADRVVMGHFDSLSYVPKALRVLKEGGGVLHVHALCRKSEIPEGAWKPLEEMIRCEGRRAEMAEVVKVKSFKPRVWHVVLDVKVE